MMALPLDAACYLRVDVRRVRWPVAEGLVNATAPLAQTTAHDPQAPARLIVGRRIPGREQADVQPRTPHEPSEGSRTADGLVGPGVREVVGRQQAVGMVARGREVVAPGERR